MKVMHINSLTQAMICFLVPNYEYKSEEIKIKNVGIRLGEKLYEYFMIEEESVYAKQTDDVLIVDAMRLYNN